jgi:hypothetical protein
MKKTGFAVAILLVAFLGALASCSAPAESVTVEALDSPDDDPPSDPHGWPRVFQAEGLRFTLYQPQLEKWDGSRLLARSAMSVEAPASPLPTFGTVWFVARTHVDKEQRLVTLDGFAVPRVSFPAAPDRADEWLAVLRAHFPDHVKTIDLERLESSYATLRAEQRAASAPVKNEPPRIIFAPKPALLVLIDGKPILRRVANGKLLRVVNTRALLLEDEASSRFYLAVVNRWLEAASLDGPWTLMASAPAGAEDARRALLASKMVDLHEEDAELLNLVNKGEAPSVFASTQPAELIETTGEPELAPIEGTELLWIRNTDADVFVDSRSSQWFVLVSGRWFRAPSREGPWSFVPGRELPPDFAKIAPAHPAGEVLASVPGTTQAQEALVANEIPQTATVDRRGAKLDPTYDGEPRFGAIEGTPLRYALNSATPIVQVGSSYYACEDGIWFVASSPRGPWTVATSVPPEVYSIPPSSPIHYVTYVHVYDATDDVVYVGYTPGYFGTCVDDGCVVWGTGFWYSPWCGASWYGYPWTYGFGVGVRWSSAWGWNVGIAMGARPPCRPWWGPLGMPHPAFYPVSAGAAFHLNLGNANIYAAWPASAVRPITYPGASLRSTAPVPRNNVYSGADGNVYRHGDTGWERRENGAWRGSAPSAEAERLRANQLEAERQQRERGADRSRSVRREPAAPAPRYEPMQPQHPSRPEPQSRPAPAPIPPGLRGGGSHGGGGGHRGR